MTDRLTDPRRDPEMQALEEALRRALHEPVPLPPGFAARVLSRISAAPPVVQAKPLFRWQSVAALAALIAILGTATGIRQGQRVRHQTAAQALQQLLLALQMTDLSLRSAEQRVDTQLAHSVAKANEEAQ